MIYLRPGKDHPNGKNHDLKRGCGRPLIDAAMGHVGVGSKPAVLATESHFQFAANVLHYLDDTD
jgi:hypothetical protein